MPHLKIQLDRRPRIHSPSIVKSKALQDNKLVKDYDIQDGATITIMSKPTTELPGLTLSLRPSRRTGGLTGHLPKAPAQALQHPSVVPSPAGSPGRTTPLLPVHSYSPTHTPTTLDFNAFPIPSPSTLEQTTQHAVLASPEFWEGFYAFL